jgi:hypothetical protein
MLFGIVIAMIIRFKILFVKKYIKKIIIFFYFLKIILKIKIINVGMAIDFLKVSSLFH